MQETSQIPRKLWQPHRDVFISESNRWQPGFKHLAPPLPATFAFCSITTFAWSSITAVRAAISTARAIDLNGPVHWCCCPRSYRFTGKTVFNSGCLNFCLSTELVRHRKHQCGKWLEGTCWDCWLVLLVLQVLLMLHLSSHDDYDHVSR